MTIVIDRSMSFEEIQEKIYLIDTKAESKGQKNFEIIRKKRQQAFGSAFINVLDPLSLQRE